MRTFWLESGTWIGKTAFSIETVPVKRASRGLGDDPGKITACFGTERDGKAVFEEDLDAAALGSPDPEPYTFRAALGSKAQPPMARVWARHQSFCLVTGSLPDLTTALSFLAPLVCRAARTDRFSKVPRGLCFLSAESFLSPSPASCFMR